MSRMKAFEHESEKAPFMCTTLDDALCFRVWAHHPYYDEDPKPWKLIATYRFLQECLEFISDRQAEGCDVVFQSPAHTTLIRSTDRYLVAGRHEEVTT